MISAIRHGSAQSHERAPARFAAVGIVNPSTKKRANGHQHTKPGKRIGRNSLGVVHVWLGRAEMAPLCLVGCSKRGASPRSLRLLSGLFRAGSQSRLVSIRPNERSSARLAHSVVCPVRLGPCGENRSARRSAAKGLSLQKSDPCKARAMHLGSPGLAADSPHLKEKPPSTS